ncbi:MAG: phage baseplate assembly protein V [Roseicyclus sp.]
MSVPNDPMLPDRFYGKHRGEVANNLDPSGLGRVQVSVPDVYGDSALGWAMPCMPGAGPGVGLFTVPPVGAKVWVEFERGDPDYPVYTGGFWDLGDTPAPPGPQQPFTRVFAGEQFRIEILDMPGAAQGTISVATAIGEALIEAGPDGLTLSVAGATVKLAPDGVTINDGNLKVLP